MVRKSAFTLVEIIVVLVIIMLITGIAAASLRGESPSVKLNRTSLELEAFLARVRFLCAESGRDYVVRYYPEENMLCAHIDYSPDELINMEKDITESSLSQRHSLGKEVEFSTVENAESAVSEEEYIEIFRFYPSGGASCVNRPVLKIGEINRYFEISFFSGQLEYGDGDGREKADENAFYVD